MIPVYTRHPLLMAQQALTAQAAVGGRLTLGLGLSHKPVVEDSWGLSFERPVEYIEEYLAVLMPLAARRGGRLQRRALQGERQLSVPGAPPAPPVLLAALGTRMLRLCGQQTDGTITWMVGPRTLESHIAPVLYEAASDAGRAAPRIVVGLPMCVTDDVDAARRERRATTSATARCPRIAPCWTAKACVASRGGRHRVGGQAVRERLAALESAGATDFYPAVFGSAEEQDAGVPPVVRWRPMDDSPRSNRPTPRTPAAIEAELRRRVRRS